MRGGGVLPSYALFSLSSLNRGAATLRLTRKMPFCWDREGVSRCIIVSGHSPPPHTHTHFSRVRRVATQEMMQEAGQWAPKQPSSVDTLQPREGTLDSKAGQSSLLAGAGNPGPHSPLPRVRCQLLCGASMPQLGRGC